jgi:hypothetical protein
MEDVRNQSKTSGAKGEQKSPREETGSPSATHKTPGFQEGGNSSRAAQSPLAGNLNGQSVMVGGGTEEPLTCQMSEDE